MLVTFISQCEKKALARTRRVLDAFADRIGSNTWQTIMTEDGLMAVKKLLRKTATKNTAVACHWARSRNRVDLLWIVGNRSQFNNEGVVPVNSTTKEVFMDVKPLKPIEGVMYANTHLQPLAQHLFAVGYVAKQIYIRLFEDDDFAFACFVAGCLHDIGKIDPSFQTWIRKKKGVFIAAEDGQHIDEAKFSFDKHPRHNEISLLLYQLLDRKELNAIKKKDKNSIKHVVLWHHAKPFRKDGDYTVYNDIHYKLNSNLKNDTIETLCKQTCEILEQVVKIEESYASASKILECFSSLFDADEIDDLKQTKLPDFKSYNPYEKFEKYKQDIQDNAINNILRSCVITADRMVSKLSAHDLDRHINNKSLSELLSEPLDNESDLSSHIAQCLTSFGSSERSQKQHEVAEKLLNTEDSISVLAGAAGCGKTKIALEWAQLNNANKIIWICPRVQVCQGIFDELISSQYLPNAKIEIFTGEFKCTNDWKKPTAEDDYFTGDVVITTIDQILGAIITHSKIDSLIDYLNAHVVFDEYHEYVNMKAFNLFFAELVECKRRQGRQNTLLVSATPHYLYLEEILGIESDDVVVMPSFNQSQYLLELVSFDESKDDDSNPLYAPQVKKTFVISNTAQTAQLSFIKNQAQENSILFHSKYKRSDKQQLFEAVYECFKKEGDNRYQVLRSGPIVQASLNISCDAMISEISTAENILQRLGRLNRFGENPEKTYTLQMVYTDGVAQGKCKGGIAYFLNNLSSLQSTKAWFDWLTEFSEGKSHTLEEIYKSYQLFYENATAKKLLESDLIESLKKSVALINKKVTDPFVVPSKKENLIGQAKISKKSLRGENVFVQMAKCDVESYPQVAMLNQYAYEFPSDERTTIDFITEDLSKLRQLGIIDYAAQKHGRIDTAHPMVGIPASKKQNRKLKLESSARSADMPIYTSYIQEHLDVINEPLSNESIVYAVCTKQAIGCIEYSLLTKRELTI